VPLVVRSEGRVGIVVRIVGEQVYAGERPEFVVDVERRHQVVVERRAPGTLEKRLARVVLRVRIRAEIMVVRDILLKDDDQVLDRGCRAAVVVPIAVVGERGCRRNGERRRETARNDWMLHLDAPDF
jgi:hypothetical protein